MRILFLTNFYPPYELGGMGQSCQQVVDGMVESGHEALVLTSMHGVQNNPVQEGDVYRWLYLEMDLEPWTQAIKFFIKRKKREEENLRRFEQLLKVKRPDLIFIWGMWNFPRSIAALAEAKYPGKVVYRFADYWPTLRTQYELYWQKSGRTWFSRLPKTILGAIAKLLLAMDSQPALKFEHAICVSAATRDALVAGGVPVAHARVIHTGMDSSRFLPKIVDQSMKSENGSLRLLYAGRLAPYKGIETVIEAVRQLVIEQGRRSIWFDIAGSGTAGYEKQLQRMISQMGLDGNVRLVGRFPYDQMPELMHQHDVLLVPSTWEEPFSRAVLEGMAAGLVVIGTNLGGTKEIIQHLENGLLIDSGDVKGLTQNLLLLLDEPMLRGRLSANGQKTVIENFTIEKMMTDIQSYLVSIAGQSSPDPVVELESVETA